MTHLNNNMYNEQIYSYYSEYINTINFYIKNIDMSNNISTSIRLYHQVLKQSVYDEDLSVINNINNPNYNSIKWDIYEFVPVYENNMLQQNLLYDPNYSGTTYDMGSQTTLLIDVVVPIEGDLITYYNPVNENYIFEITKCSHEFIHNIVNYNVSYRRKEVEQDFIKQLDINKHYFFVPSIKTYLEISDYNKWKQLMVNLYKYEKEIDKFIDTNFDSEIVQNYVLPIICKIKSITSIYNFKYRDCTKINKIDNISDKYKEMVQQYDNDFSNQEWYNNFKDICYFESLRKTNG